MIAAPAPPPATAPLFGLGETAASHLRPWARQSSPWSDPISAASGTDDLQFIEVSGPTEDLSFWVVARAQTTVSPARNVEVSWIDGRTCPAVAAALRQLPPLTVEEAGSPARIGMEDTFSTFQSTNGAEESPCGWHQVEFRILYYPRSPFWNWFTLFRAATAPCLSTRRPVLP